MKERDRDVRKEAGEAYREELDRALLRAQVDLTPEERVRRLEDLFGLAAGMRRAGRRLRDWNA